jgi:hypothetical protein
MVSRFAPGNGYAVDEDAGAVIDTDTGEKVPGLLIERDPDQYGAKTDG